MPFSKQIFMAACGVAAFALGGCGMNPVTTTTGAAGTPTSPSPTPAAGGVTISGPANGALASSPFTLSASASTCSSQAVSSIGYSLDASSVSTVVSGTSLSVQVTAAAGAHTVTVEASGSGGATCSASVTIAVAAPTAPPVSSPVPANAIAVSGIQALSDWSQAHDIGTTGASTGAMSIVDAPSLSGSAREFATTYTNSGGERYAVTFGTDTTAMNFFYDGWVYLTSSAGEIANLELDMNQVIGNGDTIIYAIQCDGYSRTWDYSSKAGTPTNPQAQWLHSTEACNMRNWSQETWHRVQASYSRDDSGNVTYHSVWLDGVEQQINETVPSEFALGWASVLLTNFQVDGLGAGGNSTIYLDNLAVYRW